MRSAASIARWTKSPALSAAQPRNLAWSLVDHPFAELGGDERDSGLLDQLEKHPAGHLAIGSGADDQHGRLRRLDHPDRGAHRLHVGGGAADEAGMERTRVRLLLGDVLRKFEVHRPGLLLLGESKGLAHPARYVVRRSELMGIFGDRTHHRDDVEDLEAALLRLLDRLLAGDHQHRHPAQLGVSRGGDQVGGAGPQGRQAHAGLAGMAPIGRRHESGALLVPGQDQPDLRPGQAVEEVQILLAGNAEDIIDAFLLQAMDEQVGCLGHWTVPGGRHALFVFAGPVTKAERA